MISAVRYLVGRVETRYHVLAGPFAAFSDFWAAEIVSESCHEKRVTTYLVSVGL
jgi:hypothetical protein